MYLVFTTDTPETKIYMYNLWVCLRASSGPHSTLIILGILFPIWEYSTVRLIGIPFNLISLNRIEGCNGRLPNQDLQNSYHRIALSNGVPVTVHDHVETANHNKLPPLFDPLPDTIKNEIKEYQQRAKNILRHVGYQVRGRPSGVHGLYHQYVSESCK